MEKKKEEVSTRWICTGCGAMFDSKEDCLKHIRTEWQVSSTSSEVSLHYLKKVTSYFRADD